MPIVPGLTSGRRRAVRGLRPRCCDRGDGAGHGPAMRVGDRAVPLVRVGRRRSLELDATRSRARAPDQPGARDRARRRHRGADGARRARVAPASRTSGNGPSVPTSRRPTSARRGPHMNNTRTPFAAGSTSASRPAAPSASCRGRRATATSAIWVRMPELLEMSAAALAIIGDFVPSGIGQALGHARRWQQPRQHDAASRTGCRPTGCSPTSACTRSPTASATGSCTCGPRTARCSATASQSTIVRAWRERPVKPTGSDEAVEG